MSRPSGYAGSACTRPTIRGKPPGYSVAWMVERSRIQIKDVSISLIIYSLETTDTRINKGLEWI